MSVQVSLKVTIPKKKFSDKKWITELARTQRLESVPVLRQMFKLTVFGWSTKPTFSYKQNISSNKVSISMYPTGNRAEIWQLLSAGSPRHDIPLSPKVKGFLKYKPGYRASTTPGTLLSRRAYRSGKETFRKQVSHPGFKARDFEKTIAREYNDLWYAEMQGSLNRTARSFDK